MNKERLHTNMVSMFDGLDLRTSHGKQLLFIVGMITIALQH